MQQAEKVLVKKNDSSTPSIFFGSDIKRVMTIVNFNIQKWMRLPENETIHNLPRRNHSYRVVIAVTMDLKYKEVVF